MDACRCPTAILDGHMDACCARSLSGQYDDVSETVMESLPPGWEQHPRGDDPVVGHPGQHGRQQRPTALERCNLPARRASRVARGDLIDHPQAREPLDRLSGQSRPFPQRNSSQLWPGCPTAHWDIRHAMVGHAGGVRRALWSRRSRRREHRTSCARDGDATEPTAAERTGLSSAQSRLFPCRPRAALCRCSI